MFWHLTPWQFKCCVRAAERAARDEHNEGVWMIWHQAMLTRQKKLPDIKKLLIPDNVKKAVQKIDENTILARFKAYQHDREKVKGAG